jgi:hypothetical protein
VVINDSPRIIRNDGTRKLRPWSPKLSRCVEYGDENGCTAFVTIWIEYNHGLDDVLCCGISGWFGFGWALKLLGTRCLYWIGMKVDWFIANAGER